MNTILKFFAATVVCSLILFCSKPTSDDGAEGGGSETGNVAFISGHLYTADGAPASGAKVCFVLHNNNPSAGPGVVDSATTDTAGWFGVDSLAADTYYVYGAGMDGDLSMQGPLMLGDDSAVIDPDTLKEPGSVSGVVQLQPGDDPRTVFVLVMGSVDFTMAEYDGAFSIAHLADGEYRIRFLSTLDAYAPLEITVTVTTGNVTALSEPVVLPYGGIPVPTGLTVSYDTLKQIMTLTWGGMGAAVAGYNVYRTLAGYNFPLDPLNGLRTVTDTVYRDSSGVQGVTYDYKVAAYDNDGTEGIKSARVSITVEAALDYVLFFGSQGMGGGQFSGQMGITGDAMRIFVADHNLKKIEKYDLYGNYISGFGTAYKPFNIHLTRNNDLAVLTRDPDLVLLVDTMGTVLDTFDVQDDLDEPYDVDQDSDGNYYVTNRISNKVLVYDSTGAYVRSWGGRGTAAGLFDDAYGIAIDDADYVYVTDGSNDRVQKFTTDGALVQSWGTNGVAVGQFQRPVDIAIDMNGAVWVLEWTGRRLQKFDGQGNVILRFGKAGDELGSFGQGLDQMWIAPDDNIWVAEDANNYRIQMFRGR